ncbi:3-deoxy-D-manno-octulosonic acid transferase [Neochlamydia sp. S13]|uniref:3-deoxy-D-manno-octulosonic acid transferase n=1 Tax=Neochlamydia sp. S13 TaxID=1353976 RepID=UPI0005A7D8AC|nr:3-deoxy-D-manno-octulosonic-acid transferase [Neochlamydia sp. S13]
MILSFLYDSMLCLLALLSLPKVSYDYFIKKKYQQSLARRLGFNFPLITKGERRLVWIHAVSVGEAKAATSLVKTLRTQLHDPVIVISSVTEAGHAEAKRSIPQADYHIYLPVDLAFIIRPIMKRAAPDLVILVETDFWYNFLKAAKDLGSLIVVVNGKISERSFQRFLKIPYFTHKLFSFIDLFCLQSKHYYERFNALGVDPHKMQITGNLKFDDEYPRFTAEQHAAWKKRFQIEEINQIVVLGSSHDPEEKMILEQMKIVWEELPHVKLIIVPRHPERFNEVARLLEKEFISYVRFSQIDQPVNNAKVILIDAMGLLRKCYQLADLAIVAGSYTARVGGHNILEPSWYGVPVLYGPYMHSQPELVELMEDYKAGRQVDINHLSHEMIVLLKDSQLRQSIGANGVRMFKDIKGATQKTWNFIEPLIKKNA